MKTLLFPAVRGFILHKGKVLIIRESTNYKSPNQGKYDTPGGKIKPDETFAQALRREVKEEVGLSIRLGRAFGISEWFPVIGGIKYHIVGTFIECFTDSTNVKLSKDHDDYKWIVPDDYKKYNIIETNLSGFKDYLNSKKSSRDSK